MNTESDIAAAGESASESAPEDLAPGQQVEAVARQIADWADNEVHLLHAAIEKELYRRSQA